jgi:hypothetical protein
MKDLEKCIWDAFIKLEQNYGIKKYSFKEWKNNNKNEGGRPLEGKSQVGGEVH